MRFMPNLEQLASQTLISMTAVILKEIFRDTSFIVTKTCCKSSMTRFNTVSSCVLPDLLQGKGVKPLDSEGANA